MSCKNILKQLKVLKLKQKSNYNEVIIKIATN